ncbi:MAG: S41 family peptidase [Lentisphaerae bacterium]|nr:S41 family peptidase [Lentisphaerota bacterium]MCP4100388.1 S41 family peptidase [Lentisphaerota bacterium]
MRNIETVISWKKTVCAMLAGLITCCAFVPVTAGDDTAKNKKPATQKAKTTQSDDTAYESMLIMVTVMKVLQRYYVDPSKVSSRQLLSGALKGMLHELDPYSSYEPAKVYKKTSERFNGKMVGVGILIYKTKKSGLKVITPFVGSPAARAGIKPGDLIIEINGHKVNGLTLEQCISMIKGPKGSEVTLKVIRRSKNEPLYFNVTRTIIKRSPVPYNGVKMLPDKVGYIRLNVFSAEAGPSIGKALAKLKKDGAKAIILDLRNNPGGLLQAALSICSYFINTGELVIFTEGREKNSCQKFYALKSKKYLEIPLVILINSYSASASEIVAGCLRDHNRAVLVGSKSFGKGSVQRLHKLANNGAIRFTIAKYYTPDRKVIHGAGIKPDINVKLSLKERLTLARQLSREPGLLKPTNNQEIADIQLQRALQLAKGIVQFRDNQK